MPARDPLATVRAYHEQTKHHFNRFARSLGYLDWATQPAPFRSLRRLPPNRQSGRAAARGAPRASPRAPSPGRTSPTTTCSTRPPHGRRSRPDCLPCRCSSATASACRRGNRRARRGGRCASIRRAATCIPRRAMSSPGPVWRAGSLASITTRRTRTPSKSGACSPPTAWAAAVRDLPQGSFLAALTSIHWREAWKYGERAFRYCQHDIGHAVAAMRMAAALMGWDCAVVPGWTSVALAALVGARSGGGLRRRRGRGAGMPARRCASQARRRDSRGTRRGVVGTALADAARRGTWTGRADQLSADRVQWDVIDAVCRSQPRTRHAGGVSGAAPGGTSPVPPRAAVMPAAALLLQRRSAQSMDGSTAIDAGRFTSILRRLMPDAGPPFDALWWTPRIHLAFFVHRVEGLQPGTLRAGEDRGRHRRAARRVQPGLRLGPAARHAGRPAVLPAGPRRLPAPSRGSSAAGRTSPPTAASASA